ncbi:GNAT family N-acetyltransferase [Streptomyces sp. NPDC096354]|uniref:GNAT family N-acetyltransferase n=1 Tax=Streptomyces sp. NPDC096354 TaxID=3366088 RepID=UPI00380B38B6
MSIDPLLVRARGLWEDVASAPISFASDGGVRVVVSPESGMCPAGWVGVVTLGGSAIVTAPNEDAASIVRDALAGLPVEAVAAAGAVRGVLSVARVLGPAALAYVSADGFRPLKPGVLTVEQLPGEHPDLRSLEKLAGEEDAGETGLEEITSPAFVLRKDGQVVAAAGYRVWPSRTAHISVLTAPAWRGRRLARAAGSATTAHALAAGLLPQWRARVPASRRVALALGFRELGAQLSIELAYAQCSQGRQPVPAAPANTPGKDGSGRFSLRTMRRRLVLAAARSSLGLVTRSFSCAGGTGCKGPASRTGGPGGGAAQGLVRPRNRRR